MIASGIPTTFSISIVPTHKKKFVSPNSRTESNKLSLNFEVRVTFENDYSFSSSLGYYYRRGFHLLSTHSHKLWFLHKFSFYGYIAKCFSTGSTFAGLRGRISGKVRYILSGLKHSIICHLSWGFNLITFPEG